METASKGENIMKKIAILGAHGTGKTTLSFQMAAFVKKECPSRCVGILGEVVRSCPVKKEVNPASFQTWAFHAQITREIEAELRNDILICDRSVLDSLAYSLLDGLPEMVDAYLPIALKWMQTYGQIYFLRPNGQAIADDGVRYTDLAGQAEIASILERGEAIWGWIHTHPGFGCWMSGTDFQTHLLYHRQNPLSVAIVLDPSKPSISLETFNAFQLDKDDLLTF